MIADSRRSLKSRFMGTFPSRVWQSGVHLFRLTPWRCSRHARNRPGPRSSRRVLRPLMGSFCKRKDNTDPSKYGTRWVQRFWARLVLTFDAESQQALFLDWSDLSTWIVRIRGPNERKGAPRRGRNVR